MDLRPADLRILSLYVHLKVYLPAFILVTGSGSITGQVLKIASRDSDIRALMGRPGTALGERGEGREEVDAVFGRGGEVAADGRNVGLR
jgi:hypothetical protein